MKKLLFIILSAIFFSCSMEDVPKEISKMEQAGNKIQPEDAVKKACEYMNRIFPQTRGENRSDYSIISLQKVTTRSPQSNQEYPDTLYYVINFTDEKGFAIMGADNRLPDLLAISDTGNLNLQDTVFNKGLASFISGYVQSDLFVPTLPGMTIQPFLFVGPPMLSSSVRKWSQREPFNKFCPTDSLGNHLSTGCTPLAVGQIMSFFEYPNSYNDTTFNWTEIKKGTDDNGVARLLAFLGDKNNLASNYTTKGTSTEVVNLKRTFNNFDYDFTSGAQILNKKFPYELLNSILCLDAHPLLLYGIGSKIDIEDNNKTDTVHSVHTWVADGCMTKEDKDDDGTFFKQFFIHCVWGFGGGNNGYFLYTYNGIIGGKPDDKSKDDYKYDFEGYVYNKDLSGWTDYKPRK